ncbi:haloacid dehalogenase-like hydrolase domain protein [Ceratobasidium sp. AG-Ba]|nr:haloacid dehalogenase-like hydrolase domain protein [Ceratobasidium sp. AG-Ba]
MLQPEGIGFPGTDNHTAVSELATLCWPHTSGDGLNSNLGSCLAQAEMGRLDLTKRGVGLFTHAQPNISNSVIVAIRGLHKATSNKPPVAFAFDIDGVLLRGRTPIPAVHKAVRMLRGENELGVEIPFILLTNGGGVTEDQRAVALSKQLSTKIKPSQVLQAHTVVKSLAQEYAGKPVLVLGGIGDSVRRVAERQVCILVYGFDAYTPFDILAWNRDVSPLHRLSDLELASIKPADFSKTPIHAIFAFHDPRNWFLDSQIVCDVLLGTYLDGEIWNKMRADYGPNPVELIFCNPDLIWRAEFAYPRLGQGGFITAFQAIFEAQFGKKYPFIQYGKPHKSTYDFAKSVLREQLAEIEGTSPGSVDMPKIYMVGDNPESDIAGANGAGWESVLVHTGVYNPHLGIPPTHTPTHQAGNVAEAVEWALHRELDRSRG